MSIAAMVDNEVAKSERKPPITRVRARSRPRGGAEAATRTSDVLTSLASYVPAEAIAAYLVLLPFMDPSGKGYSGRWGLAAGVSVLAVIYTVGYRKIAAVQVGKPFAIPWVPIVTTVFAFASWVFAIPTSPFNDFGFYTAELGGAVGTVVATGISFVGAVTGETLTAAKAT
jgi:hypothetical protein